MHFSSRWNSNYDSVPREKERKGEETGDCYESLTNSSSYNSGIIDEATHWVFRQCLQENEDKYRPNSILLIMGRYWLS